MFRRKSKYKVSDKYKDTTDQELRDIIAKERAFLAHLRSLDPTDPARNAGAGYGAYKRICGALEELDKRV
jgi:hypothetical protein